MGCCVSSENNAKLSFNESRSKLLSASHSKASVNVGCSNPLGRSKITDFEDRNDVDTSKTEITVKPTSNSKALGIQNIKIQVSRTTSGRDIKKQIFTESGIPIEQQELKFAGKEFRDDNLVHECGSMPVQYTTFHLEIRQGDSRQSDASSHDDNFMYSSSGSYNQAAPGYSYQRTPNGPSGTGYSTEDESVPKSWSLDGMLESS
eukprot:INCI11653.1.p2 GENE.INCI11653.1~~INCI11653.1.p2  ORF type:complete len:204 (+),score=22.06 INCI11653.1:101-712(+)